MQVRRLIARWLLGKDLQVATAELVRAANEEREQFQRAAAKMLEMIEHSRAVIDRNAQLVASVQRMDANLRALWIANQKLMAAFHASYAEPRQ